MTYKHNVSCPRRKGLLYLALLVVFSTTGFAQSIALSLGAASGQPGSSVSMPLSFNPNGTQTGSVEWIVKYSPADVTTVAINAGPVATSSGKSVQCNLIASGQTKCIASGLNATAISTGTIGTATLTIAPTTSATSTSVQIVSPKGSSAAGDAVAATATGNTIAIIRPVSISNLACNAASLTAPASTQCTVTLTAAAQTGGFPVSIGYSVTGASVTVPTNTTIPAGSSTGVFNVQVVSATSTTALVINASGAGVTRTASISITGAAPPTGDKTAPTISSIVVTPSTNSATVSWTTNEPASSTVEYGLSASSLTSSVVSASLVTTRTMTLSGLSSGTTIYYRVKSVDAANNTAFSPATGASSFRTTSASSTPTAGLFALWRFDETGPEAINDTGTTNPAWIYGATRTAGKSGGGLNFNGISDYVSVWAFDMPGSAMSAAAWIKADALPDIDPRIISKASGSAEQDHYFMLGVTDVSGAKRLRFRLKTNGNTTTTVASSGNVAIGQWVHAAATYDGSTVRLYLNGTQVGSRAVSGSITGNMNVPIAIGRNPGSAYGPFDGVIDQVRLYTRALSASEVLSVYQSGQ